MSDNIPPQYGSLFLSDELHSGVEDNDDNDSDNTVERSLTAAVSGYMDSDMGTPREEEEDDDDDNVEDDEVEDDDTEDDERRQSDSARETSALRIYEETHPDHRQKATGGREIADHEAIWAVSTFRPDWGVEKMRDNNPLTYWQSDCPNPKAPHTVDLLFHQATFIKQVSIFIDFTQDDSYTPKSISIRGGTTYRDLHEIMALECPETVGWQNADLCAATGEPVRVFRLQIAVLNTHLNGRDTHIRQVKVYSVLPSYLQQQQQQQQPENNIKESSITTTTATTNVFKKGLR